MKTVPAGSSSRCDKRSSAFERRFVILAEVFGGYEFSQHVIRLRIHLERDEQFTRRIRIRPFFKVQVTNLRGNVGILRRELRGFLQHCYRIVVAFQLK